MKLLVLIRKKLPWQSQCDPNKNRNKKTGLPSDWSILIVLIVSPAFQIWQPRNVFLHSLGDFQVGPL